MNTVKIKGIYRHFKGDYYVVGNIVKRANEICTLGSISARTNTPCSHFGGSALVKRAKILKKFSRLCSIVEDIAIDSETLEEVVVYRALYENSTLYARKLKNFCEKVDKVKYPNVKQEYRFALVTIDSVKKSADWGGTK